MFDTAPVAIADVTCNDLPTPETLTATDACGGLVTVVVSDDVPANPDYCAGFTVTYTWTATDACNNSTIATQTFEVLPDVVGPVFDTAPVAIADVTCNDLPTPETLTATDACGGLVTVVVSDDVPANPDYCAGFTVTYTWTATDACNNSTITTQTFEVLPDVVGPVFDTAPVAIADVTCNDLPTPETLTATDACGGLVTVVVSDDVPACLLYTSPSPRDRQKSRMPSSA